MDKFRIKAIEPPLILGINGIYVNLLSLSQSANPLNCLRLLEKSPSILNNIIINIFNFLYKEKEKEICVSLDSHSSKLNEQRKN